MGATAPFQPDGLSPATSRPSRMSGLWAVQAAAAPVLRLFLSLALFLLLLLGGLVGLVAWVGDSGVLGSLVLLLLLNIALLLHLLGHLLAAWLCKVQVRQVALGLGPALPRCRFRRGATEFRVNVLPLGGYVRLVERGQDVGRSANYPRALANRPWWQRGLVRSAGVILNAVVAATCFIGELSGHETVRTPGVVGQVEVGSPAWEEGVRSGWVIHRLGERDSPSFDEVHHLTVLARRGETLSGEFRPRSGEGRGLRVLFHPLREHRAQPSLGFNPPERLQVMRTQRPDDPVVHPYGSAIDARVLDLPAGSLVIAATDPDTGTLTPLRYDLDRRWWDTAEFDRRLRRLRGRALHLRALQRSAWSWPRWLLREQVLPAEGFRGGDRIVAISRVPAANEPYDPFDTEPLPPNPRAFGDGADVEVYRNRLRRLVDRPVVVQVRRGDGPFVSFYLPPTGHRVIPGVRMKMGEVVALRKHSLAVYHDVRPRRPGQAGDVIVGVVLRDASGTELLARQGDALDPERLPTELTAAALRAPAGAKTVTLQLRDSEGSVRPCTLEWDDHWAEHHEGPISLTAPLSIPALGLAYRVESTLTRVDPGSPAAQAGLQVGDEIWAMRLLDPVPRSTNMTWDDWRELTILRDGQPRPECWAFAGQLLQYTQSPRVRLRVRRQGQELAQPIDVPLTNDDNWQRLDRGLYLSRDAERRRIDGWGAALSTGLTDTMRWNRQITTRARAMPSLANLLSHSVLTSALNDSDFLALLVFLLGVLNVNVAVLNLLPLPFSDMGAALLRLARRKSSCDPVATATTMT